MVLFPPGKGGGDDVAYGFKGKGVTLHSIVEGEGRPLAVITTSAKGDERSQVSPLLELIRLKTNRCGRSRSRPKSLQADKGYDSRELRNDLRRRGIRPLIPRRKWVDRRQPRGRPPSSGTDRWKVERTFAWYQKKFRRLVARWERRRQYWNGFVLLAICLMWLEVLVG